MNTQTNLITRYKNTFPKDTIKEISRKTNIQQTRVFRIFNGVEMKVSEMEALEDVMAKKAHIKFNDFLEASRKCTNELSEKVLLDLYNQMRFLLKTNLLASS